MILFKHDASLKTQLFSSSISSSPQRFIFAAFLSQTILAISFRIVKQASAYALPNILFLLLFSPQLDPLTKTADIPYPTSVILCHAIPS